ncbi:MAG: NADH:flavin oxidoreductase, partial [Deltaproteobacteria bacterium]|nr:NADH:flavin oxidoreductase [Deltaproteobacteria bacterium]
MSLLNSAKKIGNLELPNRFVNSATYESMAKETGEVSDEYIKRYEKLAKGGVGLIITGLMHVHASGHGYKYQAGIDNDSMIAGLKKLTAAVHPADGRIPLQLAHPASQTTKK